MGNESLQFNHVAMATRFKILIAKEAPEYAEQAAHAAFAEVDRLEKVLSRFIDNSDITRVNLSTPGDWVIVGAEVMECLKAARQIHQETSGAFDITIGPLMACWRNPDKSLRQPSDEELQKARACVGMNLVELDEKECRVRRKAEGVKIDLGAIGKGFAVDKALHFLKEWDVENALISGGDSSIYGYGTMADGSPWTAGVGGVGAEEEIPFVIDLNERSLSGSGIFTNGRHIMDPRTGRLEFGRRAAWALHPSATLADGLSTAFMVLSREEVTAYCKAHPEVCAMLAFEEGPPTQRLCIGPWPFEPK